MRQNNDALKRSDTPDSSGSVISDKTLSIASSDRPEIIQMLPKVDVEIKFNGRQIPNGKVSVNIKITKCIQKSEHC